MNIKRVSTALVISILLVSLAIGIHVVKADSTEPLTFSSGLIVYSPVNTAYNSYSVLCNASLRVPYGYQSSIVYSIDGEQNSSNFNLNFGSSGKYHLEGLFMLPPLNNGLHQLSFYVQIELFNYSGPPPSSDFKAGTTSYGVKFYEADYVNTVSFTIYSTETFPTTTPTATPNPTSTPTVPEFPMLAILPLFIATFFFAIKVRHRKPKASEQNLKEMAKIR